MRSSRCCCAAGAALVGELRDLAASLGPDAEDAYVATAEMLRAEERAEALVEVLRGWTTRAVAAETLDQVYD